MTKHSIYPKPKIVLVFNQQRLLISMYNSLNIASRELNIPTQSISLCCLGHHISCYGRYFRHYEPQVVEVVPHVDFGNLQLEHFDRMSNLVRRYHDPKEITRRGQSAIKRRNLKKDNAHE